MTILEWLQAEAGQAQHCVNVDTQLLQVIWAGALGLGAQTVHCTIMQAQSLSGCIIKLLGMGLSAKAKEGQEIWLVFGAKVLSQKKPFSKLCLCTYSLPLKYAGAALQRDVSYNLPDATLRRETNL